MSDEDRKRIDQEAEDLFKECFGGTEYPYIDPGDFKQAYIDGAIAEHERLHKEIDKLKAQWFHDPIQLNLKP